VEPVDGGSLAGVPFPHGLRPHLTAGGAVLDEALVGGSRFSAIPHCPTCLLFTGRGSMLGCGSRNWSP